MATYLPGAVIVATDSEGYIAGYGFTDMNGSFAINDLTPGTYSVDVDKVDFVSSGASGIADDYDTHSSAIAEMSAQRTTAAGVDEHLIAPDGPFLAQNYPNPFTPSTVIGFTLAAATRVELGVFDCTGRLVATVLRSSLGAGPHTATFDASSLPTGSYEYRLRTPSGQTSKRMIIVK